MAGEDIMRVIEQLGRERGIDKEILIDAVKAAVLSASKKKYGEIDTLMASYDSKAGRFMITSLKTVVQDMGNELEEISLEEARKISPAAQLGDKVEVNLETADFGRIAAQTARQVIIQRVREAERQRVYDEYKGREGELVNGIVSSIEKGNIVVDLVKAEGIIPRREQSYRESFRRGDRLKVYILEVKKGVKGTQVILSRTHPNFLIGLFEMEVPEVHEGLVQIKVAARDPSGRSKIAVYSINKDIDPVGACVGIRGSRVQAIVQELQGEKIDIVEWDPDPKSFLAKALNPAKIFRIIVHEEDKSMEVIVPDDQLSLAIGKKGQNVRLAAKLLHWKIDIRSEEEYKRIQEEDSMKPSAGEPDAPSEEESESPPAEMEIEEREGCAEDEPKEDMETSDDPLDGREEV